MATPSSEMVTVDSWPPTYEGSSAGQMSGRSGSAGAGEGGSPSTDGGAEADG